DASPCCPDLTRGLVDATHTAARAPRAATQPLRRRAWLKIFVVRCGLPCDPPVGGHSCNGGDDTTLPSRGQRPTPIGRSTECFQMAAWGPEADIIRRFGRTCLSKIAD